MSNKIAQSYIYAGDKCWFVSTINRESSAALAMGSTYAETMAWEFNPETRERGAFAAQEESMTDSLHGHNKVCSALHKHGVYPEPEAD